MKRVNGSIFSVVLVLAVPFALLVAPSAMAADDDVVKSMSASKIERIMGSFKDVTNFKEIGNNQYSFQTANLSIVLVNSGESMEVVAYFTVKSSLSRLNEWNRTKKFSKAYLDKDNDACLHHSIELTGGVTEKNVKEWLGTFVSCLKEFHKFISE